MLILDKPIITKKHKPLLIGDMKLSEFRKVLQTNGFGSDFVFGDLILSDHGIKVKKNTLGGISLEGNVCDAYYSIRDLIYAQHVVL